MATNALPVGPEEKGKDGVKEVVTNIPGVGEVTAYFKVSTTDDVDGKTVEDVQTLRFSIPVQAEEEVEELDDEGNPKKDNEGNPIMKKESFFKTVHYEVDMGAASREKFVKALAPFVKNAREVTAPVSRVGTSAGSSKSSHDLNAIRSWAKANGHEVADKGRIAQKVMEAYYEATGKPNPDKA